MGESYRSEPALSNFSGSEELKIVFLCAAILCVDVASERQRTKCISEVYESELRHIFPVG